MIFASIIAFFSIDLNNPTDWVNKLQEYAILNGMAYSILSCPIAGCDFSSRQEKKLIDHVSSSHNLDPEALYIDRVLAGVAPVCGCGCGSKPAWLGWKAGHSRLLRGHNARVYTAFSDPEIIDKCVKSRIEGHQDGRHRPWNTGLSADDDTRLAASREKASKTLKELYSSGKLTSWQTGLSAERDPRLQKSSETKRANFASGVTKSWNKGLTKKTNESLSSAARKISNAYSKRLMGKRLSPDDIKTRIGTIGFDLINDDYKSRKGSHLSVRCRKCQGIQQRTLYSIESTEKCFLCSPRETVGHAEILEFIRNLAPDTLSNDRQVISPFELDIVVPSHRLSVEFNGLYWHSEIHRGRDYHADKTRRATGAGYRLIHIFEDEWRERRPIIESMLRHRLGLPLRKIGARQCQVVKISPGERAEFFKRSHIDGDVRASGSWGLKRDGELLACLSTRRPVHKKWSRRLEVARFAALPGVALHGALSRLSAAALQEAHTRGLEGLISYVDTRYGDGHGYLSSGYKLHSRTGPTFWWTDFNSRFNRFSYRADPSRGLTEAQVASEAGVTKVWGCDQLVMIM